MKPKLVCVDETFLNGPSPHHLQLFCKYFEISNFDKTIDYDTNTTFMYRYNESRDKLKRYENTCKFIADGVWETTFFCDSDFKKNTLGLIASGFVDHPRVFAVPKWYWFEEHHSQQDKKKFINDLPFNYSKTKLFLMQIGDAKTARIKLYNLLMQNNLLSNALYSFLEYGIGLEGPVSNYDPLNPPFPQRAYQSKWYNDTHFTLVPECLEKITGRNNDSVFITEKTMKPIMYGHPFIIMGDKHTLKVLEEWGFHTFPELFDQSYDQEESIDKRIEMIVKQIKKYKPTNVQNKIIDNFERFWNRELVQDLMIKEMIQPMLNFIRAN